MVVLDYCRRRVKSFVCAARGLAELLRTQAHARIHLFATCVVAGLGLHFELDRLEWAFLAIAVSSVWVAEALNTAVELVVDLVSPGYHPLAGKAKDVAAGAVLLASVFAAMVGGLVFWSKILS